MQILFLSICRYYILLVWLLGCGNGIIYKNGFFGMVDRKILWEFMNRQVQCIEAAILWSI